MNQPRGRILVIDDEPPIRRLLRTGLATQGFDIAEAADDGTALAALTKKRDLVILDLGLPDINRLDMLATMRARGDTTPVVILSSRDDESGKVKAFDLGNRLRAPE